MSSEENVAWLRSWGDPRGDDRYIEPRFFNGALVTLAELKELMPVSGGIASMLGHHPPSFFNYALTQAEHAVEQPAMTGQSKVDLMAVSWMDGVLVGQLIMLLMFTGGEDDGDEPGTE